ncbi:hypothetical protein GCM10023200_19480 [Actinomycetospora chlora]|uniref:DUF6602 domain-containing protein n=1 Tax=Actinomycetospora chlora TaxID=663608 RepID=A0ABP9AT06_9PSEU
MTKRVRNRSNPQLELSMVRARDDLKSAWDEAQVFQHMGTRGAAREEALRRFLEDRLPRTFSVASGQAVDRNGTLSRQLDLMVYDSNRNPPLVAGSNALLPAEAVLAVIEVKSSLNSAEVERSLLNAASVQALRPYNKPFAPPRRRGDPADDGPRCHYSVVARDSDLSNDGWLGREWSRYVRLDASGAGAFVDTLAVLERGIIQPQVKVGLEIEEEGNALQQWFIALNNFLNREARRREPVDWQTYAGRVRNWESLP